jgi:hypothetical protein
MKARYLSYWGKVVLELLPGDHKMGNIAALKMIRNKKKV